MHCSPTADRVLIGVTGHRFLAEVDKLRASVEPALARIQSAFPGTQLVVLSPLAEGADRLVAEVVLNRGGRLTGCMPLPLEDYMTDFESQQSRDEFARLLEQAVEVIELPVTETRNDAYEQAGMYVLDSADVLIAIYDGRPAQGQGGTADIVGQALERQMPVLHIRAGNRKPGTSEPTSLGREQGRLVTHNL